MKKDRNCGATPYPVYPPYQGQMGMVPPFGMPNQMASMPPMMPMYQNPGNVMNASNTMEQQLNTLEQKISLLENRITTLENVVNNSNSINYSNDNYNSSNYQMM